MFRLDEVGLYKMNNFIKFRDQFVLSLFDCSSDCTKAVDSCLADCDANKAVRSCYVKSFSSKAVVTESDDATENITADSKSNDLDHQSHVKSSTRNIHANITPSDNSEININEKESVIKASNPSCSSEGSNINIAADNSSEEVNTFDDLNLAVDCFSKASITDDGIISHVEGANINEDLSFAASCSCQEENKSSFEKILQLWDKDEEIKLESMR